MKIIQYIRAISLKLLFFFLIYDSNSLTNKFEKKGDNELITHCCSILLILKCIFNLETISAKFNEIHSLVFSQSYFTINTQGSHIKRTKFKNSVKKLFKTYNEFKRISPAKDTLYVGQIFDSSY